MNTSASFVILLAHAVEPDEVLLSVRCDLRWRARDDKVSAYAAPVTLAKLVQAKEKQSVFFLGPRNTLTSLVLSTLGSRLRLL